MLLSRTLSRRTSTAFASSSSLTSLRHNLAQPATPASLTHFSASQLISSYTSSSSPLQSASSRSLIHRTLISSHSAPSYWRQQHESQLPSSAAAHRLLTRKISHSSQLSHRWWHRHHPPPPDTPASPPAPLCPPTPSCPSPPPVSEADEWTLIRNLNIAIREYPLESLITLATLECFSFGATKFAFTVAGVEFSTLFAVAFVLSVPLRRSMLPKLTVALPLTCILKRLAPALTRVHISSIWKNRATWCPNWMKRRIPVAGRVMDEPRVPWGMRMTSKWHHRMNGRWRHRPFDPSKPSFGDRLSTLSDRYGLALLISYRMAGCIIVNSVYLALTQGIDITPVLHFFGFFGYDMSAPSHLGAYAGAVVFGAIWFPLTVFFIPYPARVLHAIRKKLFGSRSTITPASGSATIAVPAATAAGTTAAPTGASAASLTVPSSSTPSTSSTSSSTPSSTPSTVASTSSSSPSSDFSNSSSASGKSNLSVLLLIATAGAAASDDEKKEETKSKSAPSSTVTFRPATLADLPAIVWLLVEDEIQPAGSSTEPASFSSSDFTTVPEAYRVAFSKLDANPHSELIVGVVDDQVVATLQLVFFSSLTYAGVDRVMVEGVRVAQNQRGRNVGHALMQHAEERGRARNCKMIELMTGIPRKRAHEFYKHLGYQQSHFGFKKPL